MMSTSVVQVTNISPVASAEQLTTLFSFLGDIDDFRVFPSDNSPIPVSTRVCYIKYHDPVSVGVAQHLTNVVFIDRGLIVVPFNEGKIPEEAKAVSLLAPAGTTGLIPGAGLLPVPTSNPLASITTVDAVASSVGAVVGSVPLTTLGALQAGLDPTLTALGINSQPPAMGNVDPSKIEEIRRTIYVGNLNSQTTTADQLLEFFSQVGEVKFVRMAGDETQPTRFAFVEFAEQSSVLRALAFNGAMFGDRPLKINHSNNAIVKPPEMTPQAAAKELEEVMKRVREAQSFISAVIEPDAEKENDEKDRRSRSYSRSRKKRSRSSSKQRCSRSRSQHRSPSRHKDRHDSKSPLTKRSRSKDRHQSKSCSPSREKTTESDSKGKEESKDGDGDSEKKKEKKSSTPPGRNSSSRKSRSSSREKYRKKSRSLSRKRSKSPRRRSRSLRRRSRSLRRRSRSLRRRSRTPRRRSRTPRRRSRSPRRRSRSPRRRSRSPRRRSRSPRRRSRSPRRRSRSPRRRPRTPKRKLSKSPSPKRNKKEKRKDKDRGHSKDRVENRENSSGQSQDKNKRDHSTSKKKKDKEKDGKIKPDKTDIKVEGECNNEEGHINDANKDKKENTETSSEVLVTVKENGDHNTIHQNTQEDEQEVKSENIPVVSAEEENGEKQETLSTDLNDLQNKSASSAEVECP
ncbi:splicing regulatory glutamine/lysine-rich protein 1 [Rhincodon typus]|uniref:splicing regulatory glutamine/lysine-rich protein 1 n=1 Tax=Rhincodon typus TaxID=259920 RepID=UPI00202F9EC7|nr:splicing regulatory glutamine/lysine-rich protein 1 [Rhincodon typus]